MHFRIVEQCCAVFASSEAAQFSTDQVHVVKLPNVRSILCSVHALDQLANFAFTILLSIFRWKTNFHASLGRALEMCFADAVVSQLQWITFVRSTNRHHD